MSKHSAMSLLRGTQEWMVKVTGEQNLRTSSHQVNPLVSVGGRSRVLGHLPSAPGKSPGINEVEGIGPIPTHRRGDHGSSAPAGLAFHTHNFHAWLGAPGCLESPDPRLFHSPANPSPRANNSSGTPPAFPWRCHSLGPSHMVQPIIGRLSSFPVSFAVLAKPPRTARCNERLQGKDPVSGTIISRESVMLDSAAIAPKHRPVQPPKARTFSSRSQN